MKALIIIGIIYAISIVVVYSIALHSKLKSKTTIADEWWQHLLFIILSPLIILLIPFILHNAKKKEKERLQRQKVAYEWQRIQDEERKRKEELREQSLNDMPNMCVHRLEAIDSLIRTTAKGLQVLVEHEKFDRLFEHLCIDSLMDYSCLRIAEGAKLKVHKCQPRGKGDNSALYVKLPDGTESFDVFSHISFDNSIAGAWAAYLLFCLPSYLPKFWHANYDKRRYFYTNEDVKSIKTMRKSIDWSNHSFDVTPAVYYDREKFLVSACYWNDWQGLVRETVRIVMTDGKATCESVDQQALYSYDCKILF